jgi:apolipoprotein N-acyltransferase
MNAYLKNILQYRHLLCVASGLLITAAFPPHDLHPLLWVAFIPLLAAMEDADPRRAYSLGCITGTVMICCAYTWLPCTARSFLGLPPGADILLWLGYGFLHGQITGVIAALLVFMRHKLPVSDIMLFPLVTASVWTCFPALFFFQLGNGMTPFIPALQALDITGVCGLDFIIALVNILLYRILRLKSRRIEPLQAAAALIMILLWFGYGFSSMRLWRAEISSWPERRIGLVQPNRPSPPPVREGVRALLEEPPEFVLSRSLLKERPDVILWPEGHNFGYFTVPGRAEDFSASVAAMKTPLIFQDYPEDRLPDGNMLYRNSSVLLASDGSFAGRYDKRKLVPFGEYIPFIDYDRPLIRKLKLPPPVTAGNKPALFRAGGMLILPVICYELQFSGFVAASMESDGRGKVLLAQSNDGWYGSGSQVFQHSSSAVLRAVEHRVPVIHALQNGPSSIVMPDGRILYRGGFFVREARVVSMPYSAHSGGSFFTRHPDLFKGALISAFLIMFLISIFRGRKAGEK